MPPIPDPMEGARCRPSAPAWVPLNTQMIGMATPTSDRIHEPRMVSPVVGSMPPLTLTAAIAGLVATAAGMRRRTKDRRGRGLMALPFGWHGERHRSGHQRHPEPGASRGARLPARALAGGGWGGGRGRRPG